MDFDHLTENVTSLKFTNKWVQRVCRFLFSVFWIFLVGVACVVASENFEKDLIQFGIAAIVLTVLAMVLAMIIFSISKLLYWIWKKE